MYPAGRKKTKKFRDTSRRSLNENKLWWDLGWSSSVRCAFFFALTTILTPGWMRKTFLEARHCGIRKSAATGVRDFEIEIQIDFFSPLAPFSSFLFTLCQRPRTASNSFDRLEMIFFLKEKYSDNNSGRSVDRVNK